jgi:hypothetical protein
LPPEGQNEAGSKKTRGDHIDLRRIALTVEQTRPLRSFSASDKHKDPRYKWFVKNYGERCWELDAMDPRDLRNVVENAITALIDRELWEEQEAHQEREKKSIEALLRWWADIESVRGAVA